MGLKTRWGKSWVLTLSITLAFAIAYSCGKPDEGDGSIPVRGYVAFGSQCPYGTLSDPTPSSVAMWGCPIQSKGLELAEPLKPVLLQADCGKKILTVRTLDRSMDSTWEVMPDGKFTLTLPGQTIFFRDDGSGTANCQTTSTLEISGTLRCKDRDKVDIEIAATYMLGKKPENLPSPSPTVSPTPTPTSTPTNTPTPSPTPSPTRSHSIALDFPADTAPQCQFPKGCYLGTNVVVKQCQ